MIELRRPIGAVILLVSSLLSACGGGGNDTPPANIAPVANAGSDTSAFKNDVVTLNGSASSDVDNNTLTYLWTQTAGPTVALSSTTSSKPTITAPAVSATLVFSLVVNDGFANSSADIVAITVINRIPVADAGINKNVKLNEAVTLDGRSSIDLDNDTLTYTWAQTAGVKVVVKDNQDGTLDFAAPSVPQVLIFTLQVNDGELKSAVVETVISVSASGTNTAPVVDGAFDQTVPRRATVSLSGWAYDPEGQPLTLRWRQVSGPAVTFNPAAWYTTFKSPAEAGTLVFELSASDGVLVTTSEKVTIVVQNYAPSLDVTLTPDLPKVTDNLSVSANAYDADSDTVTLTYEWTQNGAPISGQATASLPAKSFVKGDQVQVTVTATDGTLTTTRSATTTIENSQPVFTATPPTVINYGELFTFKITASDADGDATQFAVNYGPAGMQVDSTGNVTWTAKLPMFDQALDANWGIGVAGVAEAIISGTVQVRDANRQYPLRRTGIEIPEQHYGIITTDLDGDNHDEILIGSGQSLYEMGRVGASYVQRWVYPFSLGLTNITSIAVANIDADNNKEIFVSTQDHTYRLDGISRHISSEFVPGTSRYCRDLVTSDLTNDGKVELVCLAYSTNTYKSRIVVFDAVEATIVWQSPDFDNVDGLAVGNVDVDMAREIILSNGYVYDGGTFTNEWASSTQFGNYLTTGDVDGDGIDEVIAYSNYSIVAWNIVQRQILWTLTSSNKYSWYGKFKAFDIDGDGADEIITAGETYNSISAYRRNSVTGSTDAVATVLTATTSYSISQVSAGDIDADGVQEIIVATGGSSGVALVALTLHPTPALEWTFDHLANPRGLFVGGQFAKTLSTERRLIFGASQSGIYGGARIVSLDPVTGLFITTSELSSSSGAFAIDMVDYDNNGIDDAFISGPNNGLGAYGVYDVATNINKWTSPSTSGYSLVVTHNDLNGDNFADLIAAGSDGFIVAYDVDGETLLWKSEQLIGLTDMAVADVNGDGITEIIAVSYNRLTIFTQSPGPHKFVESMSLTMDNYAYSGSRLLVADTDSDGKSEIFILGDLYAFQPKIYKYDNVLTLLNIFNAPAYAQGIYLENLSGSRKNLVIATSGDSKVAPMLYAIDASYGMQIWKSPEISGQIQSNSLQYVDTNGDGEREISFGSSGGMYLTR